MRVGVIGPVYPDSFAENIVSGVRRIAQEGHLLGPAVPQPQQTVVARALAAACRLSPTTARTLQRNLVRQVRELHLDVVITVDPSLHPSVVTDLRAAGAKVCLWFPDSLANLDRYWVALSPYDALFFKEPILVRRLSQVLELPVHYLPQACNPDWHRIPDDSTATGTSDRNEPDDVGRHVVVAGNLYGTRVRLLSLLLDAGVPLRIYGSQVPRQVTDPRIREAHTGVYLTRTEKAQVFRNALAVLNSMHPSEIEGVNSRLFEAAGCGANVITENRKEIPELFTPETEVLTFTSFDELIGRVKHLAQGSTSDHSLGDAAAERARNEHTYPHRLAQLLEVVS